jgi:type I restriction-modification system DNA methylase subunit
VKQPSGESTNPINRQLDRTFFELLSIARGSSTGNEWGALICLMALKFLYDFRMPVSASPASTVGGQAWALLTKPPALMPASEGIDRIASEVEHKIPALAGVLQSSPLNGIRRFPESVLADCLFSLSQLSPGSMLVTEPSMFGRWFDRQIGRSAMRSVSAGASVTPPSIAKLMVALADIPARARVLDPCCGVGTVLSEVSKLREDSQLFGQEINRESWAMTKLRLFLLDQDVDQIVLGDSLQQPGFIAGDVLQKFDCVVCDAPIGMTLPRGVVNDSAWRRFAFGHPGRGAMDNAFVQHAVQSLKPGGTAVAVVSHGFLFRAGVDARVRESLVEAGLVSAVVGLPPKLRSETAIETALVVFKSSAEHKDILFLDMSTQQPPVRGRSELSEDMIRMVLEFSKSRQSREGTARLASMDEVRSNDFSLLPRRYVTPPEKVEARMDLNSVFFEAKALEAEHDQAVAAMDAVIEELLKNEATS